MSASHHELSDNNHKVLVAIMHLTTDRPIDLTADARYEAADHPQPKQQQHPNQETNQQTRMCKVNKTNRVYHPFVCLAVLLLNLLMVRCLRRIDSTPLVMAVSSI